MMFSRALSCGAGSGRGHCTQSGSCKLKPARDKLKTKGQCYAGQGTPGVCFAASPGAPAQLPWPWARTGACWHHPEHPTGSGTGTMGQDAPCSVQHSQRDLWQVTSVRAMAGTRPQSPCSTSLPVSHQAAQAPKVPMEFPSSPMPQQRQKHPPLRFDIAQPPQTLLPTCPYHLLRQAGYTAQGGWLRNTRVCHVTSSQGLEPLL